MIVIGEIIRTTIDKIRGENMNRRKMEDSTIKTHYNNTGRFLAVLNDAIDNAESGWEEEFIMNVEARFDKYGICAYLSERQKDSLERIANNDRE